MLKYLNEKKTESILWSALEGETSKHFKIAWKLRHFKTFIKSVVQKHSWGGSSGENAQGATAKKRLAKGAGVKGAKVELKSINFF